MDEGYVIPPTHQRWSRTNSGIYQQDRQAECNAGIPLQHHQVLCWVKVPRLLINLPPVYAGLLYLAVAT